MKEKRILVFVLVMTFSFLTALPTSGQDVGEEVYVIKKGDTLWDLSGRYLNDPFQWPQLWQRNQYITNPHLIYPGNSLRLYGRPMAAPPKTTEKTVRVGEEEAEVAPVSEAAETAAVQEIIEETGVVGEEQEVAALQDVEEGLDAERGDIVQVLRKGGVEYVILEEDSLGRIIDARYRKRLLAQGDTVYLALKKRPPEVGERFLIFRTQKTLKNPYTGKKGKKVYLLGALKVTAVKGVLYQAEITDSMDAIKRGDEIMTYRTLQ
ncbi:MAG: LysM peptidoglycan-binding domain-containing protein [Proteobacteria bacterium]|nr:LysM peptidoglycan-binding domain-containing protein [Pseudomonadota bacterium]